MATTVARYVLVVGSPSVAIRAIARSRRAGRCANATLWHRSDGAGRGLRSSIGTAGFSLYLRSAYILRGSTSWAKNRHEWGTPSNRALSETTIEVLNTGRLSIHPYLPSVYNPQRAFIFESDVDPHRNQGRQE